MLKRDEIADPGSCFNKAKDDEILFVLLGRDEAAGPAIMAWVNERLRRKKNIEGDTQIVEALNVAVGLIRKHDGLPLQAMLVDERQEERSRIAEILMEEYRYWRESDNPQIEQFSMGAVSNVLAKVLRLGII